MQHNKLQQESIYRAVLVVLLLAMFFVSVVGGRSNGSPERQLYEQLSENYSRLMRPVSHSDDRLVINTTMHLYQLLDFDEKREVIESVIWIQQEWYDVNFQWDPSEYDGVKQLVLPADTVWVPDFYMLNLVGDADNIVSPFLGTMETLIVYAGGLVVRYSPYRVSTSCPVNLLKFPFDEQVCHFTYGSWAYSSEQLEYRLIHQPVIIPDHTSADWVLTGFTGVATFYPIEQPPSNFSMMDFSLRMRRRPMYHITYLIVPSMMLNLVVSFSFFLPPEAGERVSVGLTSFLAYSVMIMMMADKIPESTTTMPLISHLFLINMSLTLVSILWSVVAIRVHFRAYSYGPPPQWLIRASSRIEASWCSSLTRTQTAYPNVYNGEASTTIKPRGTALSGAVKADEGLDMSSSSAPLNVKRASFREPSMRNDMDGGEGNEVRSKDKEQTENEACWRLIICAADRSLFCVFMVASLIGVVLVFLAKSQEV